MYMLELLKCQTHLTIRDRSWKKQTTNLTSRTFLNVECPFSANCNFSSVTVESSSGVLTGRRDPVTSSSPSLWEHVWNGACVRSLTFRSNIFRSPVLYRDPLDHPRHERLTACCFCFVRQDDSEDSETDGDEEEISQPNTHHQAASHFHRYISMCTHTLTAVFNGIASVLSSRIEAMQEMGVVWSGSVPNTIINV